MDGTQAADALELIADWLESLGRSADLTDRSRDAAVRLLGEVRQALGRCQPSRPAPKRRSSGPQ